MPKLPKNIIEDNYEMQQKVSVLIDKLPVAFNDFYLYIASNSLITQRDYLLYLYLFFEYLLEEKIIVKGEVKNITEEDLKNITHKTVNQYLNDLCAHVKETADKEIVVHNSNRTLAKKRTALVQFFKIAYREKWVNENIIDGFNKIQINQNDREIKYLEENEIMDLFDAVHTGAGLTDKELVYWEKTKYRDEAIITLFIVSALRAQELRQLNISSFDWKRNEFTIYRKRGKIVKMPINSRIERAVKQYIANERSFYEGRAGDAEALFLSTHGSRLSNRQIINIIKKYTSVVLNTSRSDGYSPHKLRATAATSLVRRGIGIYEIKEYLDHDNVSTTQIYAHLGDDTKREISKEMEFEDTNK